MRKWIRSRQVMPPRKINAKLFLKQRRGSWHSRCPFACYCVVQVLRPARGGRTGGNFDYDYVFFLFGSRVITLSNHFLSLCFVDSLKRIPFRVRLSLCKDRLRRKKEYHWPIEQWISFRTCDLPGAFAHFRLIICDCFSLIFLLWLSQIIRSLAP